MTWSHTNYGWKDNAARRAVMKINEAVDFKLSQQKLEKELDQLETNLGLRKHL